MTEITDFKILAEKRVNLVSGQNGERIIEYFEIDKASEESINVFWERVEEFVDGNPFHFIVDLSEAEPPNADIRAAVHARYNRVSDKCVSTQAIIKNNILLKIAAKFVMSSIGIKNFRTAKNFEEAKQHIYSKN